MQHDDDEWSYMRARHLAGKAGLSFRSVYRVVNERLVHRGPEARAAVPTTFQGAWHQWFTRHGRGPMHPKVLEALAWALRCRVSTLFHRPPQRTPIHRPELIEQARELERKEWDEPAL